MRNPADLFRAAWRQLFDRDGEPELCRALDGGSINSVWLVESNEGPVVMKCNDAARYPRMLETEARGLQLLQTCIALHVPGVYGHTVVGDSQVLLLDYLPEAPRQHDYFEVLGRGLASLHRLTENTFGLEYNNWMGALPQSNTRHTNLYDFMREERLLPQYRKARKAGYFGKSDDAAFDRLCQNLEQRLPAEPPALIHGDLWKGNVTTGPDGQAWLIDPAVAYSHREADLAMTQMFGGFDDAFYAAYHEAYPLQKDWEDRIQLLNLYPLLIHVNLFGSSYVAEVKEILHKAF